MLAGGDRFQSLFLPLHFAVLARAGMENFEPRRLRIPVPAHPMVWNWLAHCPEIRPFLRRLPGAAAAEEGLRDLQAVEAAVRSLPAAEVEAAVFLLFPSQRSEAAAWRPTHSEHTNLQAALQVAPECRLLARMRYIWARCLNRLLL